MKRLSPSQKIQLDRLRRKRQRKALTRRYRVFISVHDVELSAPRILSFSRNSAQTQAFFEEVRTEAFKGKPRRYRGRTYRGAVKVDMTGVEEITVPVAVLLCAEFHRYTLRNGSKMRLRKLNSWAPKVRQLIYDLGGFKLLGISDRVVSRSGLMNYAEQFRLIGLKSGEKADTEALYELQEELAQIMEIFSPRLSITRGLVEAAANAVEHAYQDGLDPEYPYAGHRWWATACYDPVNDAFRFFVYDQGVGIPATLRADDEWKGLLKKVAGSLGLLDDDADVIARAIELTTSRHQIQGRGNGMRSMLAVVEAAGAGYMRVLSGKGDFVAESGTQFQKKTHGTHIGGTLIEWSLPLSVFQTAGEDNESDH